MAFMLPKLATAKLLAFTCNTNLYSTTDPANKPRMTPTITPRVQCNAPARMSAATPPIANAHGSLVRCMTLSTPMAPPIPEIIATAATIPRPADKPKESMIALLGKLPTYTPKTVPNGPGIARQLLSSGRNKLPLLLARKVAPDTGTKKATVAIPVTRGSPSSIS